MNFNPKNRGANTKEHWEEGHRNLWNSWPKDEDREALVNIIYANWKHYLEVVSHIFADKQEFYYNKILDLGCGINKCLPILADTFPEFKIVGVDFTDTFIEFGNQYKKSNLEYIKQDFLTQAPEENYDVIMMLEVFEHIEPETAQKVLKYFLARCRYLFITVPVDDGFNSGEHLGFYNIDSFNSYNVAAKYILNENMYFFKFRGDL